MYTLVAVYLGARVIDFIQEGAYSARGATIISVRSEEIAREINQHMDRGVTVLSGRGSYTGNKEIVLYCVLGKNEIVALKNTINQLEPHAFLPIGAVHDVLGER